MTDLEKLLEMNDIPNGARNIIQKAIIDRNHLLQKLEQNKRDVSLTWSLELNIFDNFPFGIISINTDFIINAWNKHIERFSGLKREEVLGSSVFKILPHVAEIGWDKELINVMNTGKPVIQDKYISFPNFGQYKDQLPYYLSKIMPMNENGKIDGILILLEDVTLRKHFEDKIQASEQKFRSLFEEAPIPFLELDFSGVKKYFEKKKLNKKQEMTDFLESNPSELKKIVERIDFVNVNESFLSHFEIDNKDTFKRLLLEQSEFPFLQRAFIHLLTGSESYIDDATPFSWKGKNFYNLYKISVVPGFEESLETVIMSVVDITDLKSIEISLRSNEAKFRRLFEDSPIALREMDFSEIKNYTDQLYSAGIHDLEDYFETNPDEMTKIVKMIKTVNFNNATLQLFEAANKDDLLKVRKKTFESKFVRDHQEHHSTLKTAILRLINGEKTVVRESVISTAKGNRIITYMTLSVVPGFEKSLSKVIISNLDITRIKEAQNTIIQSEKKIRSIIEQSRDGIILISEEGVIIEWNHAIAKLTGIDSDLAIGKDFWEIYTPLMPSHVRTASPTNLIIERLNDVLKTGKAEWLERPLETEIALPGGGHKYVQINIFPIKTQEGYMIGSIWRNVTKQKQLENKMRQELLKFNIEDQNLYLVKEADPVLSREVLRDLLRIGYSGLILSRTPEVEYREKFEEDFKFFWLAETVLEEEYSSLFYKIESTIEALPPMTVVLIERLDFLISKFGFKESLLFIYKIREIAIFLNLVIILSVDDETISKSELKLLEKETRAVESRTLAEIPLHLLEILRFIYQRNNIGQQPSYTQIAYGIGISRPTARKRIKNLTAIGYLKENQKGRTKVLELTLRGLNAFTQK
ncbi:MAG: PAS domain S-box protein [Candidatus Hodarchaeales archaeon]|jgi:PAS domain S-box-containing protein